MIPRPFDRRRESLHPRRPAALALALAAALTTALGCGSGASERELSELDDGSGDFGAEPDAPVSARPRNEPPSPPPESALTARSNSVTWYRWSKGEPDKRLHPVSTHICGINMVRGELARDTQLTVSRSGSDWVMFGRNPGANFLQMDVVCEPLSAFRVNAGSTVSLTTTFTALTPGRNTTVTTSVTPNTAPILTSISGAFNGAPERASLSLGFHPSVSIRNGTAPGIHHAAATALNFGLGISGQMTPFYVPEFETPTISYSNGPLKIIGLPCTAETCPASISEAFCTLISVSGDFNGADEWVIIYPDFAAGRWRIDGFAGQGSSVDAQALCVRNDQRRAGPIIH